MSLKHTLKFIRDVRADESLRTQLRALGNVGDLENIIHIGAQAGYDFTGEDLRTAFKQDWTMRWLHYSRGGHDKNAKTNSAA